MKINKTDKQYILLVNKKELYIRARELGYDNVSIITRDRLTKNELIEIKESCKVIVFLYFGPENGENIIREQLKQESCPQWCRNTYMFCGIDDIDPLEDSINNFPDIKSLESILIDFELILDTDYTNRCGNCHSYIGEDDHYCQYCGTKKGNGKFLPFKNPMYAVYGPTNEVTYKCRSCNHVWMDFTINTATKYCPACGKLAAGKIFEKMSNFFGFEIEKEEEKGPVLFHDEQVEKLLCIREEGVDYWGEELFKALDKIGIDIINKDEIALSEKESEQLTLAKKILESKGVLRKGQRGCSCKKCGSEYIGVFLYKLYDKDNNDLDRKYHAFQEDEEALVIDENFTYKNKKGKKITPLYLCLRCGKEFGSSDISVVKGTSLALL